MKKITCIVDNAVAPTSPFWADHGLAFWIETDSGSVLFDTGNSPVIFMHNLELLGHDLRAVDALVLSHAHADHTGSLAEVLARHPDLYVYAHPDVFRPRFSLRDRDYKPVGLRLSRDELSRTANLRLSRDPVEILPGVWTSGEITDRPELEGRSSRNVVPAGDGWLPDPYADDMSLVVETREGLALVCGCCHAGLLNTLSHVHRTFARPIIAVLGGTHLMDAGEDQVQHVIAVLSETYAAPRLSPNHCTGMKAYVALAHAFGERVQPCPAGTTLAFD